MALSLPDIRWIDLEGAANVRDLGGLPLAQGGTTTAGVVVRADNLQDLTPADVARLVDALGVQVVVDLRTGVEVAAEGAGPLVGHDGVEIRHRSLYPESGDMTDVDVDVLPWQERAALGTEHQDESPAVQAYLGYLRHRPDSIVGALRDIATTDGATVVHCAAGKDRTGMICALALATAGVEPAAIVADYVATGERLHPLLDRLRSSPTYADDIDTRPAESHRPRAETMERVLQLLDERHGGPAGWLERHGLGAAEQAALRARLTT